MLRVKKSSNRAHRGAQRKRGGFWRICARCMLPFYKVGNWLCRPMNEKQTVESLRAKYWNRMQQEQTRAQYCALVDEIVRELPVERVPASRLKSMPGFRNRDELNNQKKLKGYCEDVRSGCSDDWKPLIVWGLPESGPLSVRDGSHRNWAIQNNGAQDLSVKVVFIKVGPLPDAEIDGDSEVVGG